MRGFEWAARTLRGDLATIEAGSELASVRNEKRPVAGRSRQTLAGSRE